MKKTSISIYILSIVVIGILAFSVIFPTQHIVSMSLDVIQNGFTAEDASMTATTGTEETGVIPIQIQFEPTTSMMFNPTDSIQFSDGKKIPFVMSEAVVVAPTSDVPNWIYIIILCIAPIQVLLIVLILWKLIRFLINVIKERIFVTQNVKYIRQISTFLLLIALCQICDGLCQDMIFSIYKFSWPGYELGA